MEDFFLNTIGVWAVGFFNANPGFSSFLMFLGMVRLLIKPAMSIIQIYVKWTPYDHDDKWLIDLEQSKGYKFALYMIDWLLSVKGPKK